ncbi:NAD(P)H-dependent oxidoreductase [Paramicrobacterium fandaimingii]|uniref:NAD(P)H-dependent oxidoreductase n=1 Tax=Paramicrobacterium fandaimingii TaxID=2708079 RepID=UPI0014231015|nr:NAD(P)H-dependent oxidoreductase [Microbacterium fandaimingii]
MRILFVVDHPYTLASAENVPHRRSFTAAVAAAAIRGARRAGHDADVIDLTADEFSPVMSRADLVAWRMAEVVDPLVADYQRRLREADHVVFAFPIWWEAMPAATKGFLDRVLTKGIVFDEIPDAAGIPFRNKLTGLRGVTLLTIMTTPHAVYRWWFGSPATKIIFKGTFGKIGVKNLSWRNYASVTEKTPQQRQNMITQTEQHFAALRDVRSLQSR